MTVARPASGQTQEPEPEPEVPDGPEGLGDACVVAGLVEPVRMVTVLVPVVVLVIVVVGSPLVAPPPIPLAAEDVLPFDE